MDIFSYPCTLKEPTAVALGRFDGVHLAHQKVIKKSIQDGLVSTVFTFCDNPGKTTAKLLTTEKEKHELIKKCGTEILVSTTFESVKDMSAEEFVCEVLCKKLNAKAISCGYNYHFAKGASADVDTLKELCKKYNLSLTCTEEMTTEGVSVSSTAIRTCIMEGNINLANKLLGRPYTLEGTIIHGNALGRTINTPTLNIDVDKNKLLPCFGVYATRAYIDGKVFDSVTNIGIKPTVGSDSPTIETYLLDFSGNFYNESCKIELVDFIRKEEKFCDLTALKEQIAKDIEKAKHILK